MRTHYQNLKVAENAPQEVIRAAWRALSQQYHPDVNPGDPDAGRKMQIINDAYHVLSDPLRRKAHDDAISKRRANTTQHSDQASNEVPHAPAPRMWQTFVYGSVAGPYSLAELAALQRAGKISLASYVSDWGCDQWEPLGQMLKRLNKVPVSPRTFRPSKKRRSWTAKLLGLAFRYPKTAAICGIYLVLLAGSLMRDISAKAPTAKTTVTHPAKEASDRTPLEIPNFPSVPALAPLAYPPVIEAPREKPFTPVAPTLIPAYVRPKKTPLGYDWPLQTSYMPGCPILADGSYCQVTIDNSRNYSDVHVKLMDVGSSWIVRECFIKAGGRMLMDNLQPSQYQVRYMDLGSGSASKAEAFSLVVSPTASGYSYSTITLTLYLVRNGNMHMSPIKPEEF